MSKFSWSYITRFICSLKLDHEKRKFFLYKFLCGNNFYNTLAKDIYNAFYKQQHSSYMLTLLIIHMKKLLDSDWLRAVQFKCNTSAKSVTPVQKV